MTEQIGQWVEPDVNYVHPERRFCGYCGRPIARRYWEAQGAGGEIAAYCSPDHAERKATYPANLDWNERPTDNVTNPGA
jgi:hypothetical protein